MISVSENKWLASALCVAGFVQGCGGDSTVADAGLGDAGFVMDAGLDCAALPDGTSCGAAKICMAGACEASACGDGFVDTALGEACEDGNDVDGDGCDNSCQFSCTSNADCDDSDLCNGVEVCQVDHTCSTPPALDCDDDDPCTIDSCDPVAGCSSALDDADHDGFASTSLGACKVPTQGGDCDDDDGTTYPDAPDGCDGSSIDNDCDGDVDEDGVGMWYADCDGDDYALDSVESVASCTLPGTAPSSCPSGTWTQRDPASAVDCDDSDLDIHPGATEVVADGVDQDCDGVEICYRDRDDDGFRTDETVNATQIDCLGSGNALASEPLEWTNAGAAHVCQDSHPDMNRDGGFESFDSVGANGNAVCPVGRRWDFNADGVEELGLTTIGSCTVAGAGCILVEGWEPGAFSVVPYCGATWVWIDQCARTPSGCFPLGSQPRQQLCR